MAGALQWYSPNTKWYKGGTLEWYNSVKNEMMDISWIRLKSDVKKGGFSWVRLQLPVQHALAMTINKAQG